MKAILLRVGIDSGKYAGEWNAPCNPANRDFVYVPVPAGNRFKDPSLDEYYVENITLALDVFSQRNQCHEVLPESLKSESAHLDPDFSSCRLSYGNSYNHKGKPLNEFCKEDGERYVIFYNSRSYAVKV